MRTFIWYILTIGIVVLINGGHLVNTNGNALFGFLALAFPLGILCFAQDAKELLN